MQETLHIHPSYKSSLPQSDNGLEAAVKVQESDGKELENDIREIASKQSLFKNWPLMSSIIVYCIFSLHDMAYSEVKLTSSQQLCNYFCHIGS